LQSEKSGGSARSEDERFDVKSVTPRLFAMMPGQESIQKVEGGSK